MMLIILLTLFILCYYLLYFYLKYLSNIRKESIIHTDEYYKLNQNLSLNKYKKYNTLFFAGNSSCLAQAADLVGPTGINMKYNGIWRNISSNISINVIINLFTGNNNEPYDVDQNSFLVNLLWPFYKLSMIYNGINNIIPYCNDMKKINIGQEQDIIHAVGQFRECIKEKDGDIILYGVSRGSAVSFGIFHKLSHAEKRKVKAIIVQGPFDSVENVINARFGTFGRFIQLIVIYISKFILNTFTLYKSNSEYVPLNYIKDIPIDIPILIIMSEADTVVNPSCTRNLFYNLQRLGFNTEVIHLKSSPHSLFAQNNICDMKKFHNGVISFYNKYLS